MTSWLRLTSSVTAQIIYINRSRFSGRDCCNYVYNIAVDRNQLLLLLYKRYVHGIYARRPIAASALVFGFRSLKLNL
jgi:hypothetical protein